MLKGDRTYKSLDDIPYPSFGCIHLDNVIAPTAASIYLIISIGTKEIDDHSIILHRILTNDIFYNVYSSKQWLGWKMIK